MDGKCLVDAFIEPPAISRTPSWEELSGNAGMHPPITTSHSADADQALQQLIDLGYVAPLSSDEQNTIKIARLESEFNLAVALLDGELPNDAIPLLESLHQKSEENRFTLMLAEAYVEVRRFEEARNLLQTLLPQTGAPNETYSAFPKADLLLGVIAFEEERFDDALAHFEATRSHRREPADAAFAAWLRLSAAPTLGRC